MRILVFSDTHGRIEKAIAAYKGQRDIELVVHLGDVASDAQKIEKHLGVKVLGVKGNMDGSFSSNGHQILNTEFGKILITHGHMESVKNSPQNLLYKAEELGCKAAFYGHTHVPLFAEVGGIYLLNPGSLTLPAGGRKSSYAVATITEKSLSADIFYVSDEAAAKENTKSEGQASKQMDTGATGALRDLLNNSDRF